MKVFVLAASVIAVTLLPADGRRALTVARAAPAAQAAHRCENIQLLARAHSSQGAAGTIGIIYRLHNMWGQACTLYGYPGIQLLDRNFVSLPTTVNRGGGFVGKVPERTIRVSAHGNAYFAMLYSDVPRANAPPCARAHYVMIIAPNDNLPVVTYASPHGSSITECGGIVHVSPVTARPRY